MFASMSVIYAIPREAERQIPLLDNQREFPATYVLGNVRGETDTTFFTLVSLVAM